MESYYKKKYEDAMFAMKQRVESGIIDECYAVAIFPELGETEDDKMVRAILSAIRGGLDTEKFLDKHGTNYGEVEAWLEKKKSPKMKPKWLYRLEYKDNSCGLWYNGTGEWCFENGIGSIDGCKTKTLPMDYDERYKQDGRDWFSSCSRKEDLLHWFSLEDAKKLIENGFVFTRYLATEYHEYELETVFIKETSMYREEIDIFDLFKPQVNVWDKVDINTLLKVKVKKTGEIIDGFYDGGEHFDHYIDHDIFDRYNINEVEPIL